MKKGFTPKLVPIHYDATDPHHLIDISARCIALTQQAREWCSRPAQSAMVRFDGTIGTLVDLYISDPESPFLRLKSSSRLPYLHYAGLIIRTIGKRRVVDCDGRDAQRWFDGWAEGGKLPKANTCIAILKSALNFGIMCRHPGCADLRAILRAMQFEKPSPRRSAPTADQVKMLRTFAHKEGHPAVALALAVQFETMQRLWDVVGEWLPLSDPTPSAIIRGREKWVGPQWSDVSESMILRWKPAKTARTTGVVVECDLSLCPMVMEELERIDPEDRTGPLIRTLRGYPYPRRSFQRAFRKIARKAGLPDSLWCRDLRAGGITDARMKGALLEDAAKAAGHADTRTTARVYDRGTLEAHRRVAEARAKNTP
ncbi:tyrosine-type recombinase/integrase [Ancylobacter novellus]|uniref:tyrosine-type recombinase/integrase n=1 Tax=Ancylobacter novellus TaxID=921 RepID=UPI0003116825|nr:hypothetical protein [Ancylobacter novellus]